MPDEQTIESTMKRSCRICSKSEQFSWRIEKLETNMDKLNSLLTGTLINSVSTLVGIIVLLVMNR
ncbi:MAG: hypothetical protein SCH70_07830 [Candidatus Methanoperedens sp.]|nr:hypothetical protein [Candidatus Methanoperedens sp.]